MKYPQRNSLTIQTVAIIKEMIVSGELSSPLPGERLLASKLQIGRNTIRQALSELERSNWISSRQQGTRRKILKKTISNSSKTSKTRRVSIISPKPLELMESPMLLELDTLRELLASRNILLTVDTPPVFHISNPNARLKKYIQSHRADAWILFQCTPSVQKFFQDQKLPCFIRGHPHPHITLPFFDLDLEATARHAGNILTSHGHREIAILIPDRTLHGLNATIAGLKSALYKSNSTLHVLKENGDKDSVIKSVSHGISTHPKISALLFTRPRQILNTITWLASHGIRIPKQLSIIATCHESWFLEIFPTINHYRTPHIKIATQILRRINNLMGGLPIHNFSNNFLPEYIKGESLKKLADPPTH